MIDEKKLIEERPEWLNPNCVGEEEYNKGWNACNIYWCNTIDRQPKVGEWIPCSERLPDNAEHDWVLAQMQGDDGFMCIPYVMEYRQSKDDWYLEGAGWLKDVYSDAFKVIAWQPLPEPWKGEVNE